MRFRILGPLEFHTGRDWSPIGAPKWRSLLATLLLNLGQPVSADRLIAELWGDDPPDSAPNSLSVYVLRLRRLLGDAEGKVLTTRTPGYQARLDPDDLDARSFEELVRQGRQVLGLGDPARAATVLTEALSLWRGSALADVPPSPFITAEAGRLEELRLTALELRAEAHLRCGLHAQLVPELRRLLSDQPLREELWSLLMRALDGAGRHAEAVAAYGQARAVIASELGVDPGTGLQRLYQEMLTAGAGPARGSPQGASGPPGAAGPGAAVAQPGTVLPGSPRAGSPQAGAAQPGTPRPGAGQPAGPAQLPADIPDFTGREDHLKQLIDLLAQPADGSAAVAVAVVAGAGGLGKTALAVHAAHALREAFPDGQLYVNMLGASQPLSPDEVLARLLRDLGVAGAAIPVDQQERSAMYRTRMAGRRILVVLDDARDAAQIRPLLPGTGSCAVIVTSRHRLPDLAGSRLVDPDVLSEPEARLLFARIIGAGRADAEPGPVADVLDACAGLPLAIRIAGARLSARRGWSVATLASRLADQRRRIDEFTAGDLAVRACFQVSFEALPRPERPGGVDPAHAFGLLGVWQGPSIGLQAAAALLGQPQEAAADALEILVDASLLESPAPDRYRFHDLLRAYAAEQAQGGESAQVISDAIGRLLAWYLRACDAAASVLSPYRNPVPLPEADPGPPPPAFPAADDALSWYELERANLVAATRQAASRGLHDIAWKLPVTAMISFELTGHRAEWITTHQIALASARELGDRLGEARVLNNLGMVLGEQRADDAIGYFERSLDIHREIGDRRGQAQAANNLAFSYRFLGRHEESVTALLSALELQREVGARRGEAIALCNLGESYLDLGQYDEAITRSEQALAVATEIDAVRLAGYAQYNLGRAKSELGDTAAAVGLLEQALAIHRGAGDRYGEAQDLQQIGIAQARAGAGGPAREAWLRALAIFDSLGDRPQAEEIRAQLDALPDGPEEAASG
ncbi:MAG TPA: BTAD domain-containing putative transcriptional regulator [Streptosporangiaceae bacterium]